MGIFVKDSSGRKQDDLPVFAVHGKNCRHMPYGSRGSDLQGVKVKRFSGLVLAYDVARTPIAFRVRLLLYGR